MPLPKESRLVDFLPFEAMMADGKTITTKRGDLVQIIRIAGAELQVTNENEHRALFTARRTWLSQIAERRARARVFTVRTAIRPGELVKHPIPHMRGLADAWEKSFEKNSFHTDHYIVLRSEEHTSELQSLMRISYAVFCLKKKTTKENISTSIN